MILGLILDLHHLTVSTYTEFISATIDLLWMTKEAEALMGKVNHIAFGASLAMALHINNATIICTSKWFHDALRMLRLMLQSPNGEAQ